MRKSQSYLWVGKTYVYHQHHHLELHVYMLEKLFNGVQRWLFFFAYFSWGNAGCKGELSKRLQERAGVGREDEQKEGSKRKKEALYCGCPSTAYDNTCWLLSVLPKSHWPLWELFSSHSVQNRNTQWIFAFTHSLLENCFPGSPGSVLELEEHHSWTHSLSSTVQLPTWLQAQCPQPQTAFLSSQTALFALQQPAAIETLEISYGMWTQKGHTTVLLTAGRISSGLFDSNPLPKSNALLSEELTWENPKELTVVNHVVACCTTHTIPASCCIVLLFPHYQKRYIPSIFIIVIQLLTFN